jgi:A/G-specific adenine glycosylase
VADYPEYLGAKKAVQKKFEGSDRQVRGLILAELRASDVPVALAEMEPIWADDAQFARALAGLLEDGLVVGTPLDGYELPS